MVYSTEMKTNCVIWLIEDKSPTKVLRRFHQKYGINETAPSRKMVNTGLKRFEEMGTVAAIKRTKEATIAVSEVIDHFQNNPQTSIRRAANGLNISKSSIQRALKSKKFHAYKPHIVQKYFFLWIVF